MKATITREKSTPEGTFGEFVFDGMPVSGTFRTAELPWEQNANGESCIPVGTYECVWLDSPKFKTMLYEVTGVPGRSRVLIHSGNFAGDTDAGWQSDVEGCILLGKSHGVMPNKKGKAQHCVVGSRVAIAAFHLLTGGQPFSLTIVDAP